MSLRRTYLYCRLRGRLITLASVILLVSATLLYRSLITRDGWGKPSTADKLLPQEHKGHRLQPRAGLKFDHDNKFKDSLGKDGLANLPAEFQAVRERDLLSVETKTAIAKFLVQLYPKKWKTANETDEVALELKHLLADYGLGPELGCRDIDKMKLGGPLTLSRTKSVDLISKEDARRDNYDYGFNGGRVGSMRVIKDEASLALKTFNGDTETKITCMKEVYDAEYCNPMGSYRLLREILLLSALDHPGILSLKGYCLRGSRMSDRQQDRGIVLVTEVGTPLSQTITFGSTWNQKLWMALQVARLLQYFERSPVGSLRFNKLDLKDFVLVNGKEVKLADLDDIAVEEKKCAKDTDCRFKGRQFPCKERRCVGSNAYINLDLAAHNVLLLILAPRPHQFPESDTEVADLLAKLQRMEVSSTQEVVDYLQMLLSKAPPVKPVVVKHGVSDKPHHNVFRLPGLEDENIRNALSRSDEGSETDSVLQQFERHDHTNLAGIFDYPCEQSRVSWGCFHTATSLKEAATLCLEDKHCKMFITFSSKPESDSLMTIVMKNASDLTESRTSSGTTLFVRLSTDVDSKDVGHVTNRFDDGQVYRNNARGDNKDFQEALAAAHKNRQPENEFGGEKEVVEEIEKEGQGQVAEGAGEGKSFEEISECLESLLQRHTSALYSKEKRLMTHLGLKGIREKIWRHLAMQHKLQGQRHLVKAEGGEGGGRFTANLTNYSTEPEKNGNESLATERVKKVTFIAEDGPKLYHTAYAVLYHLDRILGIFHTPPSIVRELSEQEVSEYKHSSVWYDTFRDLITDDGLLTGVVVVPTPKIMRVSRLTLQPLDSIVSEIVPFSRQQKLQLEYVILWWLGRIEKTGSDILGYKGHLIHFDADHAFSNTSTNLSGYMYHCQFPKVVHRILECFRCRGDEAVSDTRSEVCSLGEEVIIRATSMFPDDIELYFHQLQESDLMLSIDMAASDMLKIVDRCVHMFGRSSVLY